MDFNFGFIFSSQDALGLPMPVAAIEVLYIPLQLQLCSSWSWASFPPSALMSPAAAEERRTSLKVSFPLASSAWQDPAPLTQPRPMCGSGLGEKEKSTASSDGDRGLEFGGVAGRWCRLPERLADNEGEARWVVGGGGEAGEGGSMALCISGA
jgi:hypothetical protein